MLLLKIFTYVHFCLEWKLWILHLSRQHTPYKSDDPSSNNRTHTKARSISTKLSSSDRQHTHHTHSHTNNDCYLETKPNAYLSEGMSLAIGCFPPDPFLIEFCLVSPWDRAFSTKGADKSPEGPWNWVCSCSLAFFSCGASSFRSPRRTLWSGCCGVLDPLL